MAVDFRRASTLLDALANGRGLAEAAESADLDRAAAVELLHDLAGRLRRQARELARLEADDAAKTARAAQRAGDAEGLVFAFDGGSRGNPGPAAGVGAALEPGGAVVVDRAKFLPEATNNVAEYHGLLLALDLAKELGVRRLKLQGDSELIVKQLQGVYKVKHKNMIPLFVAALRKLREFEVWEVRHVPRAENTAADDLVNRTLDEHAPRKRKKPVDEFDELF